MHISYFQIVLIYNFLFCLYFNFQVVNHFPHLFDCFFLGSLLAWRDLLIIYNFVFVFSSTSLRKFLNFLFKGCYCLHKVIFKVISICFVCIGMFRSCWCWTTVFWWCHIILQVVKCIFALSSITLVPQCMLLGSVLQGVPHPLIGTGGAYVLGGHSWSRCR